MQGLATFCLQVRSGSSIWLRQLAASWLQLF